MLIYKNILRLLILDKNKNLKMNIEQLQNRYTIVLNPTIQHYLRIKVHYYFPKITKIQSFGPHIVRRVFNSSSVSVRLGLAGLRKKGISLTGSFEMTSLRLASENKCFKIARRRF